MSKITVFFIKTLWNGFSSRCENSPHVASFIRLLYWFVMRRGRAAQLPPWPADPVTNDKCNDFALAGYRLAIAPFKRCRAAQQQLHEQLELRVRPPLANSCGKECENTLSKDSFFPLSLVKPGKVEYSSSSSNIVSLLTSLLRSKWRKELHWERKFSWGRKKQQKTKMETAPFSSGFKDYRMTTWRFLRYSNAVLWTLQWRKNTAFTASDCRRAHIYPVFLFKCFIWCMSRWVWGERRPESSWLPTHEARRAGFSASLESPGSMSLSWRLLCPKTQNV